MSQIEIKKLYFDWMYSIVCTADSTEETSFRKLLEELHTIEFTYKIKSDSDRANDGVCLRRRFAAQHEEYEYDYVLKCLDGPCTILEMMIALSIRCEEAIMNDPKYGDRTKQWFWKMIVNLGLGGMRNSLYDSSEVKKKIDIFLNHEYEPNGSGSLFMIKDHTGDMRSVNIWTQMCYFLDTII